MVETTARPTGSCVASSILASRIWLAGRSVSDCTSTTLALSGPGRDHAWSRGELGISIAGQAEAGHPGGPDAGEDRPPCMTRETWTSVDSSRFAVADG